MKQIPFRRDGRRLPPAPGSGHGAIECRLLTRFDTGAQSFPGAITPIRSIAPVDCDGTPEAALIDGDCNARVITDCGGAIMTVWIAFAMTRPGVTDVAVDTASFRMWAADPEVVGSR